MEWQKTSGHLDILSLFSQWKSRNENDMDQVSTSRLIKKQTSAYPRRRILVVREKEWNSDLCPNTDEPWRFYAKWNMPVLKGQVCTRGAWSRQIHEDGKQNRRRMRRSVIMSSEFPFGKKEKFWETIVMTVAQQCEYTRCRWHVRLKKGWNGRLYDLYISKI